MRNIIYFFLLFILGCASVQNKGSENADVFIDDNNILNYKGEINLESVDFAINVAMQKKKPPVSLRIESTGGDVLAGIKLGKWLYSRKMNVIVDTGCASSCANYIFPAGYKKYLSKKAILIWHGGSYQESINKLVLAGDEFANQWRMAEDQYFELIGVDHQITIRGFSQYSFWDKVKALVTFDPIAGFDYSLEDLEKFGVKNIILEDNDWDWRNYSDEFNVFRAKY